MTSVVIQPLMVCRCVAITVHVNQKLSCEVQTIRSINTEMKLLKKRESGASGWQNFVNLSHYHLRWEWSQGLSGGDESREHQTHPHHSAET